MSAFIFPSKTYQLTSKKNRYRIRLNYNKRELNLESDISGIDFPFTEGVQEVRLMNDSNVLASFDESMQSLLAQFPIYCSMCPYMIIDLEVVYKKEWLAERETVVYEGEIPKITGTVSVVSGPITFNLIQPTDVFNTGLPVKQKINLTAYSETELAEIDKKYGLERISDTVGYITSVLKTAVAVKQKINLTRYSETRLAEFEEMYGLERISDTVGYITNVINYKNGGIMRLYDF